MIGRLEQSLRASQPLPTISGFDQPVTLIRGIPVWVMRAYCLDMPRVSVVVLDPRLAPRDQTAWAFTHDDDAQAVAGFLNARLGDGDTIAWVETVRLERKLSKRVLRYLDSWADLAEESLLDDAHEE